MAVVERVGRDKLETKIYESLRAHRSKTSQLLGAFDNALMSYKSPNSQCPPRCEASMGLTTS